ncbi:hypothetical protein BD413DRAFT_219709 [Trametes elegans]|nr:hypothetical protein BD413DRAFT_219709 [Trametes elegans]
MFARPPRLALRLPPHPRAASSAYSLRCASNKTNPWPEPQGDASEPARPRTWVYRASRIVNFFIIPSVLVYAVFFAEFGDHEHVFQPPRRWLQAQKASFFALSPEERQLAGANADAPNDEAPNQGAGIAKS